MENVATIAKQLTCKEGSVRSLATGNKKVFEQHNLSGVFAEKPNREAWEFAKSVAKEYGKSFTEKDAQKHFKKKYADFKSKPSHKSSTKKKSKSKRSTKSTTSSNTSPKKEFSKKAEKIAKDENLSKNERFRKLKRLGYSISQIRDNMGISKYQRVSHVIKKEQISMIKKFVEKGLSDSDIIGKMKKDNMYSERVENLITKERDKD